MKEERGIKVSLYRPRPLKGCAGSPLGKRACLAGRQGVSVGNSDNRRKLNLDDIGQVPFRDADRQGEGKGHCLLPITLFCGLENIIKKAG